MIARGVWHQFGNNSQTLALEVLEQGVGVGTIISPRDLRLEKAEERCPQYQTFGAQILLDYQFCIPEFGGDNANFKTYSLDEFRNSVATLHQLTQAELDTLSTKIEEQNQRLGSSAVLAPAVLYEPNRPECHELNGKLFEAAKRAGDVLGVPTFATVGLAHSTVVSPHSISDALAHATSLPCDGWYFLFEFTDEKCRIPNAQAEILACGLACLTLASNLKPVIHAYAGPMALMSFGLGMTGAGIGHTQTLWQFDRRRWSDAPSEQGGSGRVAPRFFTAPLWGTVVYPDEVVRIPLSLRNELLSHSPFSHQIADPATHGVVDWRRGLADRHHVYVVGNKAAELAALPSARAAAQAAIEHLGQANSYFAQIAGLHLKAESQCDHQTVWRAVLQKLLDEQRDHYDYLEMMA